MHEQVAELLICPVCRRPLIFEGKKTGNHLVDGFLKCDLGHLYQVKEEIGLLKDAKLSANEFEWKVDVADEKRYDEMRRQYDSYFQKDQKAAQRRLLRRLVEMVALSREESGNMVLDIATGMGTFILPLIEKGSESMLVIGTDIDEKPLRGLMIKAKRANTWHKLSLMVMDAKHLALKNDSLVTVSSHFGFDSVPEIDFAFRETVRVLRAGGRVFFSSLWLKEGSESMRLADKHSVCQIASERRLKRALTNAGLTLEHVEEIYSGIWPHNPMDLLPVEGDEYKHVIVQATKM